MQENRRRPVSHQLQMSLKRNELKINNEVYKKKVQPPTTETLLKTSKDRWVKLDKILMAEGETFTKSDSKFIGYAMYVKDFEEVRNAYLVLRKKHATATHVMCAYSLSGSYPTHQDYSDDEEHGGGRAIK